MQKRVFLLWLMLVPKLGLNGRYRIFQALEEERDEISSIESKGLVLTVGFKFREIDAEVVTWLNEDHQQELEQLLQTQFLTIMDECYPDCFRDSPLPPIVLFYQGDLNLLTTPRLGIVGARKHSAYGTYIVQTWVPKLVEAGLTTVSGLAQGIDGLVHSLTLDARGKTIAVIGTGLNQVYPKRPRELQSEIGQYGLVLSEYLPNERGLKHHFPERNRLIASLSEHLLIIEARARSGTLITANQALDDNKGVMAVPGRVDAPLSRGCNELIVEGAQPVLTVSDVLTVFAETHWVN
ncbi:MAG: DNA-processing protein DprA [Lactobacillaceae bacterium]|jgi:DNA processing protein|nr:DNA-processing protein DprA [Lactobacillaceae bacterium]